MTRAMIVTLALATTGQVIYQIEQRLVPANGSPLVVLTVAYAAASLLCFSLAWSQDAWTRSAIHVALNWSTAGIAISIVTIETGYLLAYRYGWTLGSAFASASTVTIFALAILGQLLYADPLSLRMMAGIALSAVAFWLLVGR